MTAHAKLAMCFSDIEAAAARLKGHAVRTPLQPNAALDERTQGRILIKPEMLQVSGSFKFRGAFNRIVQIPEADRARGVVAWSSGNHAQGVAASAARLGIPATIIMPKDAPALKIANTRGYGAEVRLYDRYLEDRDAIGLAIAAETGAVVVPPFDDPDVMAGQGTVGLEMAQDAKAMGLVFDDVLVCCAGGGLSSGVATAIKTFMPEARIWTVEPLGFEDTARSLEGGTPVTNSPSSRSICDALQSPTPGKLTFPILQRLGAGGLVVSDEEALDAMAYSFRNLKLVVEPGGAVALAAVLSGKLAVEGRTVGVVMSGGNVDRAMYERALARLD
ncbi:serine/threonine dehydratase [Agaricicola taiwanensis]|uniref:Serine/threonine dehydratase n=1 Tax=Agaricicola taiwanensis TaxID=591372 RepID=A0A8J2YHE9_9RHOB|nr:threonine/serine dehydratase [Agaricicola taiwanensis]GGE42839.1 serine/threonine dehydratase [Agaricicola taiwanensis]